MIPGAVFFCGGMTLAMHALPDAASTSSILVATAVNTVPSAVIVTGLLLFGWPQPPR